jgi:hypothetical protein
MKIKIIIIKLYTNLKQKYNEIKNMQVLKKSFKLIKDIMYLVILYFYMPDAFIHSLNILDDQTINKYIFRTIVIAIISAMFYNVKKHQ